MKHSVTRFQLSSFALLLTISSAFATNSRQTPDADSITLLLRDPQGSAGTIQQLDEGRAGRRTLAPLLDAATLIEIDFSNRTELEQFLLERPRRVRDIGEQSRLVLPGGAGSLYAYKRRLPSDVFRFGLLYLDEAGQAKSVLELDGYGSDHSHSPMLSKVAISRDGSTALVATKPQAGGNLLEVDLRQGTFIDRTADREPQDFRGEGLALGSGWGFGISSAGILRFSTSSSALAELVLFPDPQPAHFSREAALSENGLFAVTVAGSSETAAHPFTFTLAGPASCAGPAPMHISSAGYLPNSLDGPFLAVSNEGEDCAWIAFEGDSRELYFSKNCATNNEAPFHLTQDALFHPYLDEIGLLSYSFDKLLFSAGDRKHAALGGLTLSSYFRAEWSAPGVQPPILDLAHAYEDAQPPFLNYTSLEPLAVYMTPARDSYVIHSMTGEFAELSGVRLNGHSGQLFTLLSEVKGIEMLEFAGDKIYLAASLDESDLESQVFDMPANLEALPNTVLPLDEEDLGARIAHTSGTASFVAPAEHHGHDTLWHFDGVTPTPRSLSITQGQFGKTLAVTKSGSLVFTVETDGPDELLCLWEPKAARPRILLRHTGSIQILPAS